MAADALSCLPTSQIDESDIDDDMQAYEADDAHAATDFNLEKTVKLQTIQSLFSAKNNNTNCPQLARYAESPTVPKIASLYLRARVLGKEHNATISGHLDARRLYKTIRRSYY